MELNLLGVIILIALLLIWNVDFVATLLNLKSLTADVPDGVKDTIDADKYSKSQAYTRTNARFGIIESLVGLFSLLVFWLIGGFGWLDEWTRGLLGKGLPAGLLFLSLIYIGHYIISLPITLYSTFVIEERFGFNRTTPKTFVVDQIKSLILTALLGLPLAAGVLWIFENVGNAWIWAWILFTVVQLLLMWLAPTFILPLFNKFEPMKDGSLRESIEKMAEKCGFPVGEISVMDGSKRSTKANAYFTGFGKTKKIALYDTLVEEQTEDELVAVLAHEIGHFKCRHIIQRMIVSIVQSAVLFFLLGIAVGGGDFSQELFEAFGVSHISAAVGLVLFGILFSPVSRLLGILSNAWSRKHEFEADAFAVNAMGSGAPLTSALKKLSAKNLSNLTPHQLRVVLDYSHPPLLQRLSAISEAEKV